MLENLKEINMKEFIYCTALDSENNHQNKWQYHRVAAKAKTREERVGNCEYLFLYEKVQQRYTKQQKCESGLQKKLH